MMYMYEILIDGLPWFKRGELVEENRYFAMFTLGARLAYEKLGYVLRKDISIQEDKEPLFED